MKIMKFLSEKEVERLRKKYPKGTVIECIQMNDIQGIPSGTLGTVTSVDDEGTIHMNWETGSSLGLIIGEDKFQIKEKPKNNG